MYKRLGDYIRIVDVRNRDLAVEKLLGLSISKDFIGSIANTIGTDMSTYKVVSPRQFGYGPVTSRNGDKITIAFYTGEGNAIISQAYTVFEVIPDSQLLPEYLMLWFRRPEFDRYARFKSHGSAREVFDWDEMCDVMLPVPPIEEQRRIVAEYQAIEQRIENNRCLITKLEETAQTIYRKMFVDDIDVENLPDGWRMGLLSDVVDIIKEKIEAQSAECYISTENMLKNFGGVSFSYTAPAEIKGTRFVKGDILLSNIRPYFKKLWYSDCIGCCSNDVICLRAKSKYPSEMPYYIMANDKFFNYVMAGANGVKMPRGDKNWIMKYRIPIPADQSLIDFEMISSKIKSMRFLLEKEIKQLDTIKSLLLIRISKN
jgi:type I restriction enzyme S subunit